MNPGSERFNLTTLNVVGNRTVKEQRPIGNTFDILKQHFADCHTALDYTRKMAERRPRGLGDHQVRDYMTAMRAVQGGLEGMAFHVDRMWSMDDTGPRWKLELRNIGETIVGMHMIAVSMCAEIGTLLGDSSPTFKKLRWAVDTMVRFQLLVRKHGPCPLHEKRQKAVKVQAAVEAEPEPEQKGPTEEEIRKADLEAAERERLRLEEEARVAEAKRKRKELLAQRKLEQQERAEKERLRAEAKEAERKRLAAEKRKRNEEAERKRLEALAFKNRIAKLAPSAQNVNCDVPWRILSVPDWAFGAHETIADIAEALEASELTKELTTLREAYGYASKVLNKEDFTIFLEVSTQRVHGNDKEVNAMFAMADKNWKALLARPKQKGSKEQCSVLFLGDPPSSTLCDIFAKNRWTGVFAGRGGLPDETAGDPDWCKVTNIGKMPENAGRPLTATWVQEDRSHGLFEFIYVNSMFQSNVTHCLEKERILPLLGDGLPPMRKPHYVTRLREFREHLYTALQRLADGGNLCLAWSGPPYHPVLFFIMASLRKSFGAVHLLTPSSDKSFEIYIFAVRFTRTKEGHERGDPEGCTFAALQTFLENSQRSSGCDDVLMWCPTPFNLLAEFKKGGEQYENALSVFARKTKALAEEVGAANSSFVSPKKGKGQEPTYPEMAAFHLQALNSQGFKLPKIASSAPFPPFTLLQ